MEEAKKELNQGFQNEQAQLLLEQAKGSDNTTRKKVCEWIIAHQVCPQYKYQAYNILGCTQINLNQKEKQFKYALEIAMMHKFNPSQSLKNLSDLYLEQNNWIEALKYSEQLVLSGKGTFLINSYNNMGQAYLGLNQIDKCLEHFQLAYNESVTKLGFDHKSTKEVGKQINLTRQRQRYENNKEQQLIQKQIPYHNNKRVIKKTSKAQNYQPDKIVEQDQELKLNYNENLTSNLQTFLVEFSKNKNENSQDIKILCCNLINEFFDYAEVDIEIKISNVNQNQVDHIQQEYKDLNISINRSGQKQKPNQTDTNSNQKVYTMQEQTGNNISSKQKMVYIQEEVVSEYIVEALQKDIQFKLDDQSYQYIIRPKFSLNQTESNKFFDKFKNRLDHTIILTYNLQSHVEASQILNILNYQSIQQKLCQSLNLKEIIVFLSSNICLNNFEYYPELKKQAEILKQNSTQIILLAQRDLKDKIYQIQQQFNQFVQNSRKYQLNNDLFEIVLENKPDLKVIQSKVKQLQEEVGNFNIIIKEPIVKIESNKNYVFQAEMEQLNDENIKICQIQQNFQKMKEQILKIFFPCLELKIFDRNKIKLWNNFLNQYHNDDEKENWSIQQELNLRIKGEQDLINKKEQIIIQDLNNYQFQSIYFNSQEKILQVIKNKQKFDELYKQTFVKISQKFGKCLIKIVDIDIKGLKFKVEVYFDNQIEISQISQQLQEQFFDQLNIYQEDIEILDILSFLRKTKRQFQEEYQIVVSKMNREYCFIGNNENLNQIKQLLVQIKQSKKEKIIKECIKCPNQIIFNSLKQQQNDQGLFDNKDIQINYLRDFNITLCSLNQQIIKNKCENLSTEMKQLEQRIQKKLYIFQEKRTKFIEKNLKDFCKNNLEEENNIFIKFQKNYYKIISELELGNKLLQILHADIKQLECDAIVNFSNHPNTSLRQLVNQILEFGGYDNYKNVRTYTSEVEIIEMEQFSHIRFIINIKLNSLQNYNYNNLKQCIEKLFERIKDNSQIKSLAIPLFFQDDIQGKEEIVQQYLQIIINKFFEAKNLQRKIYITENNPQKTDIINKALIRIYLHPNMDNFNGNGKMTKVMRTIMNKIMNKQMKHISHFYKQIMKQDFIEIKFQLAFKYTFSQFEKINFKRQKILYQYKLTVTYNRGVEQYFINGEQIESELNQYLCQQKKNNCFEFDIFWKCLLVIINQYYINQINLQTNYSRQIRKIQSTILFGENFKFSDSINSSQSQENQFQIESFNSKQNDKILQKLKEEFQKSVIKLNIQIPQIKKDKLKNLYNYFDQVALNKIEDFTQGKKIVIEIFKKNQSKFLNQIGFIENFGKNYPKKWISQNDNCVKVPLNMSSLEFIKVQNHFCQSDFGNIKAIFRIQNKILWNNYVNERNKLIELYQSQGYNLNKIERKRFLWHGVKNEHPKKIYEGEKEGFDCSYSNKNSSWGPGINELIIFVIYFAENACYSRNYSYELKYDDDQQYVGLKVFLCCLVTTGKTELRNPDPNILRPNDDYDCVTGTSNESEIFVLYQMDVRRAYLAYEVIFE